MSTPRTIKARPWWLRWLSDTKRIQRAIDETEDGSTLHFGPGVFRIDGGLYVPHLVKLDGAPGDKTIWKVSQPKDDDDFDDYDY